MCDFGPAERDVAARAPCSTALVAGGAPAAESLNALYKAEPIRRQGPWRAIDNVETAKFVWAD